MRTITVDGVRYAIASSDNGPVLIPASELLVEGDDVKHASLTYKLVATFVGPEDVKMAVIRARHATRSPYKVVPFDQLRPAES